MKKLIILFIVFTAFTSCEDDLTKSPDFISEDSVFEDENLTEAYIANLYARVEFQQGTYVDMGNIGAAGAENKGFANWQSPNVIASRNYNSNTGPGPLDEWNYSLIRDMNYLLENITASENLDPDYINAKIAEVRWLRAFQYFNQVKNFGGVPLITEVQPADLEPEEYYVPRNSEEEVYDFIYNELEAILPEFSNEKTGASGRIDKYTVLMLESRAMLYAASIAKNGTPLTNDFVGLPQSRAQEYFQKSYDASQAVIQSQMFSLKDSGGDKAANFTSVFIDSESSPETIFAELYEPFLRGHDFDLMAIPDGYGSSWNANYPVFYEMVELYDFTDGRSGMIDRSQFNPNNEWDINDFFGNRDPRFLASVFYQEAQFQGQKVYTHTAVIQNGETFSQEGQQFTSVNGETYPGAAPQRNRVNTALLVRKRIDESDVNTKSGSSGVDYILFRYAETLLNHAEAAFYLEKPAESLDDINQIRERAGMPLRDVATEDNIRHERQVELMFEDQRYYDLLRWRVAEDVLSKQTTGLVLQYDLDTDKYVITFKKGESYERSFGPERYYLPFGLERLAENPNLVQNPGYN